MSEHGTHSSYVQGCRCEACTEAHRAYNRQTRANRRSLPAIEHGRTGFQDYGCRCDVCREANAAYQRDYRDRS